MNCNIRISWQCQNLTPSVLNDIYKSSLTHRLLEDQCKNWQTNLPDVTLEQYHMEEIPDLKPVSRPGTK